MFQLSGDSSNYLLRIDDQNYAKLFEFKLVTIDCEVIYAKCHPICGGDDETTFFFYLGNKGSESSANSLFNKGS